MAENKNNRTQQPAEAETQAATQPAEAEKQVSTQPAETEKKVSTQPAEAEKQAATQQFAKVEKSRQKLDDEVAGIIDEARKKVGSAGEATADIAAESDEDMIDISSISSPIVQPEVKSDAKGGIKAANVEKVASSINSVAEKEAKRSAKHSVNKPNKGAEKTEKKRTSSHLLAKVICGVLVAGVLTGASMYGIYKAVPTVVPASAGIDVPGGEIKKEKSEPVFLNGIKVGGVDVSGKTADEAKSLLALRGTALIPDIAFTVNYDGVDYSYKKDDFDFTYDLNKVVDDAFSFSRSVEKSGSTDIISTAPGDGTANVDTENNTVDFKLDYKVTQSSVQKVIKRIAKKVDIPCVEPHVSKFDTSKKKNSQRYTFKEGSNGMAIDQDILVTDAIKAFNNGDKEISLTATSYESKPTLKMDDVKKATKLIGKFSTISTNTWNANSNMETALNKINGTILEPGETFSFNDSTGNSNLTENGYLPAGVIERGAMTTGVGGGICQAATTIYNAGIMANMEIVEREPHLWCSYYVYGGLDATIDWGAIDLKLKNNSKYQMFFRTWMDGTQLNVEIYGWQSPDFDEVRTETELDWSSSEAYGYLAERVFYKNGKEVKREDLPYSQYSLSNGGGIRGADPGDVSTKLKQPE